MNRCLALLPALAILCLPAAALLRADWPTYMQNPSRTGVTAEELTLPLTLQWVYDAPVPQPSWPGPAKSDYFHNRHNLKPMVTFDVVNQLAASGGRVYFGSSADGALYCLDAAGGKRLWAFHSEGPIRLAPTVVAGKVIFGSDDGHVYAVAAADGKLLWRTRIAPKDRRIGGTGKIISAWPVRAGGLVRGGKAYFSAGIFPKYGVYFAAIDIQTGKVEASRKVHKPVQGYMADSGGTITVQPGRIPKNIAIGSTGGPGPRFGDLVFNSSVARAYRCGLIAAGTLHVAGGDGKVAAYVPTPGGKAMPKLLWEGKVEGKAHGLAIDGGRLFVSTIAGKVYCFGPGNGAGTEIRPPKAAVADGPVTAAAKAILAASKVDRGYCLVAGARDGRLACALAAAAPRLQIVCVAKDRATVEAVGKAVDAANAARQVSVHLAPEAKALPYADYLFNLVVHDQIGSGKAWTGPMEELRRVLRPDGGVALLGKEPTETFLRGPIKGAGTWNHYYGDPGNSGCSGETNIAGPMQLQWFGPPGPREMADRHNRSVPPIYAAGRLFISGYDHLYCVDAYNGSVLWEQPVKYSVRMDATRDAGNMAAVGDTLYMAVADKCIAFNARTGDTLREFSAAAQPSQQAEWGFLACIDDLLIGSATRPGAHRRKQDANSWRWAYDPGRPLVCSDSLFACDIQTGKRLWTYTPRAGVIVNAGIAAAGGRLYLIESTNPESRAAANSKVPLATLVGKGSDLLALELQTGREVFRQAAGLEALQHTLYLSVANGVVLVTGSRTEMQGKRGSLRHDLHGYDAGTGTRIWDVVHTAPGAGAVAASHGENAFRAAIVGDAVYIVPGIYDLKTGKARPGTWGAGKRGCGSYSLSANAAFFRGGNLAMSDLKNNTVTLLTVATRPGCWVNILPVGGLVLAPESSSGCTCAYGVQTSLGLVPAK